MIELSGAQKYWVYPKGMSSFCKRGLTIITGLRIKLFQAQRITNVLPLTCLSIFSDFIFDLDLNKYKL